MTMSRIRATWTGFPGAPGVSTFYSLNPAADLPLIHGFFAALIGSLPADVTIQVEGSGDVIDETTGNLTGGWSDTAPAAVQGTSTLAYAAPAGFVVIWETGVVMDQSRLRGKTYIVPAAAEVFAADGSLSADNLPYLRGAAEDLAAANDLVVWHRPRAARAADGSRPAVTARAGGYSSISGATIHDIAAILTSRRD